MHPTIVLLDPALPETDGVDGWELFWRDVFEQTDGGYRLRARLVGDGLEGGRCRKTKSPSSLAEEMGF